MIESRYPKYIRTEEKLEAKKHPHPEVTSPVLLLISDPEFGNLPLRHACMPVTEPFTMESKTNYHDFDQFLTFSGGDMTNMMDLGGEVEFTIDEEEKEMETFTLTRATSFFIPKGLLHGPLVYKRINNHKYPILHIEISITNEYYRKKEFGNSNQDSEYEAFLKKQNE